MRWLARQSGPKRNPEKIRPSPDNLASPKHPHFCITQRPLRVVCTLSDLNVLSIRLYWTSASIGILEIARSILGSWIIRDLVLELLALDKKNSDESCFLPQDVGHTLVLLSICFSSPRLGETRDKWQWSELSSSQFSSAFRFTLQRICHASLELLRSLRPRLPFPFLHLRKQHCKLLPSRHRRNCTSISTTTQLVKGPRRCSYGASSKSAWRSYPCRDALRPPRHPRRRQPRPDPKGLAREGSEAPSGSRWRDSQFSPCA